CKCFEIHFDLQSSCFAREVVLHPRAPSRVPGQSSLDSCWVNGRCVCKGGSMKEGGVWIFRVLAIALVAALVRPGFASAQDSPRPKPLPPKKSAAAVAAIVHSKATASATSSWQVLTNQPPVLDIVDCGPGSPVLLTDGTVLVADNGCQDW